MPEPAWIDIQQYGEHDQEWCKFDPDKASKAIKTFEIRRGQQLPRFNVTAFAPTSALTSMDIEEIFAPGTRPEDRRQLLNFWNLNDIWEEQLESGDKKFKVGEPSTLTYEDTMKLGNGRTITYKATARTQTTMEEDGEIKYPHTFIDQLTVELNHTPARAKIQSIDKRSR